MRISKRNTFKPFHCLCIFLTLAYTGYGQQADRSMRHVLSSMEAQHGITFSFEDALIDKMTIHAFDEVQSLESQMQLLSDQTGMEFQNAGSGIYVLKTVQRDYCAKITDKESGETLPGAQLVLVGKPMSMIAGDSGIINFTSALTFQDTVVVKHLGYTDAHISVRDLITNGCAEVGMEVDVIPLEEVIIVNYLTNGINADLTDHSLEIKTNDLALLPGETDTDILLSLRSLPGITSPNGKAGNLHVRGGTTDQTLVLFDNIPIYHKGHYIGAISPYNPALVQDVKVYRSGHGPSLGGRVGGVIEMSSQKTVLDSTLFRVGLNTYYGTAMAQVPLNKKFMVTGAVRYAYPDLINSPKLEAISDMVYQPSVITLAESDPQSEVLQQDFSFYDLNLTAVYNLTNGQIFFSSLGIVNEWFNSVFNGNQGVTTNFDVQLRNRGANLQWQQFWNQKISTKVSVMRSSYKYFNEVSGQSTNRPRRTALDVVESLQDFSSSFDLEYLTGDQRGSQINFGYQMHRHKLGKQMLDATPPPMGGSPPSGPPPTPTSSEHAQLVHSGILSYRTQLAGRFSLNGGIRSNYYTGTSALRLEPRLMLNASLSSSWSVKFSGGMYSQFIHQPIFFDFNDSKAENFIWTLANAERPIITSKQFMVGTMLTKNDWILDIELYKKVIDDLQADYPLIDDTNTVIQRITTGSLTIHGLDVLIRKHWQHLDAWLSYSYTRTEMDFPQLNQLTFKTYYDQPHVLNIATTYSRKNWKFSTGWQLMSGTPIYTNNTFFPKAGPSGSRDPEAPIPIESSEGDFTFQHQLDMAIAYDFTPKRKSWQGTVGFAIQNVYNREILVEEIIETYNQNPTVETRYAIGFAPSLMLNLRF